MAERTEDQAAARSDVLIVGGGIGGIATASACAGPAPR